MTALHWAVRGQRPADGAAADSRGRQRQGRQPLRDDAAVARRAERRSGARRLLLKAGADANGATPEGETVLMTAARTGNAEVDQLARQARRQGQHRRAVAGADAADVRRVAEQRGGREGTDRARRQQGRDNRSC